MTILSILVALLLFGGVFYLIYRFVPPGTLRTVLLVGVAVVLFLWLLSALGMTSALNTRLR